MSQKLKEQVVKKVNHIFEFFADYSLTPDSIELEYVKSETPLDVEFWIPTMKKINRETFYEVVDFLQDESPGLSLEVLKRRNGLPPRFHLTIYEVNKKDTTTSV